MNTEYRYLTAKDLEVRRAANTAGRELVGYAVRYDSLSEDMGFRERFARGAFTESLANGADVRALVDHDPGKIIGRSTAGTLELREDEAGVRVTIHPPDTQVGNDVIKSVERGDLTAMSFGFRAPQDTWTNENGTSTRTVHKAELLDVSVCAFPTYPDTSVAVRSLDRWRRKEPPMSEQKSVVETPEDNTPKPSTQTKPAPETPEESVPKPERRSAPAQPVTAPDAIRTSDPMEWRDCRSGKEVRVLGRDQSFADLHKGGDQLSLGRAVRALIVGSWADAPAEHRALSTTANPTAGILAPNPLSATVIDKARALSVLSNAGARVVDIPSGTLTIARVATDATMEVHAENTAFSGSDIVFDAV